MTVQVTSGVVPAAEARSTAGPLFSCQCSLGTILLILYSIVLDWRVSRPGPMLFYWPELLYPVLSSTIFPFIFFLYIYRFVLWGWGHRLLGCISLSLSLALTTSFNNNNNNNHNNNPFSGNIY